METAGLQLKLSVSRTFLFVVIGALLVMAVLVGGLGMYLRGALHEQILSRDVTLIEGVVALRQGEDSGIEELDLIDGALATSELRGVVGLLIVDAEGEAVISAPEELSVEDIPLADRQKARQGAFGRFHEGLSVGVLFPSARPGYEVVPFVEMVVPLYRADGELALFAQIWMDGAPLEAEFSEIDQQLLMQAAIAWVAGATAVLAVSFLAFLALRRSERALLARTEELARMNRELEMAARSAAVGSISAHLMHGLKSPLAGLRAYLRAHGDGEAIAATQRMQQLVQETLRVLRQDSKEGGRPLPLAQIWEELAEKCRGEAGNIEHRLLATDLPDVSIPRRPANLLRLVLDNLVSNALEAAPEATTVELSGEVADGELRVFVRDRSGGIPDRVRERLFAPGVSSKTGGTGLGLAISRQLMNSLQGDLNLHGSDADGSCFVISLPMGLLHSVVGERSLS